MPSGGPPRPPQTQALVGLGKPRESLSASLKAPRLIRRDVHLGAPAKHRGLVHARGIRSERRLRARAWRPGCDSTLRPATTLAIVRWLERQLAKAPNGNLG